jgi:hypothetical protein
MRNGINYTFTVWESRDCMLGFMRSGAHAKAMREERNIGIFEQTYGYQHNFIPGWDEAILILQEKGRVHFDHRLKDSWKHRSLT